MPNIKNMNQHIIDQSYSDIRKEDIEVKLRRELSGKKPVKLYDSLSQIESMKEDPRQKKNTVGSSHTSPMSSQLLPKNEYSQNNESHFQTEQKAKAKIQKILPGQPYV